MIRGSRNVAPLLSGIPLDLALPVTVLVYSGQRTAGDTRDQLRSRGNRCGDAIG